MFKHMLCTGCVSFRPAAFHQSGRKGIAASQPCPIFSQRKCGNTLLASGARRRSCSGRRHSVPTLAVVRRARVTKPAFVA